MSFLKFIIYAFWVVFSLLNCSLLTAEISDTSLNWANKNPVATVGIEDDFPPFDYVDEKGNATGVGELIRQQLSEILPIDLQVISKGKFATQLEKLAKKKIDVISVCAPTPERSESMLFTKSFLTLTPIIVVHKSSDFNAITDIPKSANIAVPAGYATITSALNIVDKEKIVEVDSTFTGIEMVNSGKVDGLITYLSAKNYFIQKHGFTNLQALPLIDVEPTRLGFCVDKQKPELVELLNTGIDELGSDYFNHLQAEWIASLSNKDVKSTQTSSLAKMIVFSLVALLLLIFLIWRNADLLAIKFETLKFKAIYFIGLITIFFCVFFVLEHYFKEFKAGIVKDQMESFDITEDVTIKALDDLYNQHLKLIKEIVHHSSFLPNVALLMDADRDNDQPLYLKQVLWLQAFFNERPYATDNGHHYQIITRDGRVLLNSRGQSYEQSEIHKNYPLLFEKALSGESASIPSLKMRGFKFPVVNIIRPIINLEGEVIAILAISNAANKNFSSLFNDVRLGLTFEAYSINQQGFLLSESRFINQLHKDGTLPFGKSSILQMSVADAKDNPIAYDVKFKKSGRNLTGYEDYMGHTVVGQWSWIEKYNFMLITEVSVDEMYEKHTELRRILFIAMVLAISLMTATSLFMFIISHRATQMNRLSKSKLEELVSHRTQALAMSEEKNSLIVDSVADGILGLDAQGQVVFFNSAAEFMLGYKESEILNKNYQDVLYFCDAVSQNKEQIKTHLFSGQSLHVEKDFFCHSEGFEVAVSYSLSVISDDTSAFKAVITFQDISQRLLESERTRALLTSLPVAIFLINMDKKVVQINDATEELLGYKEENIVGKELVEFIPADRRQEHLEIMEHFFAAPKYIRMGNDRHITVQKKSGEIIEVEAIFSVLQLNAEPMIVLSALDITETNQAKNLLIEAKELADDASRAKSDFLANMSHEIRTPMNAIIGMSMLALQGVLAPKERNYVSKVHSAASNLLGIINDILDFSKIEAGKLELENQTFALADMLDNFSTVVGLKTQEKGVDLLFNIDHDVPLFFKGDLLRLNQILINLGGNAIKFTDQGSIILKVSISEVDGDRLKLLFSVKDSGIGIKPDQLKKLFSAFSQADASTTRKYGGTGLGLSISKRLVELMEGNIWAESTHGQGSEFLFTAWLTIENKDRSLLILETAQTRLAGKSILIVDDSLITLTTLKEVVEGFGCEVLTAHSGKEAIQIAEKVSHIDFALIDWDMPTMNGLETCDALQRIEGVVIDHFILISAYGKDQISESDYTHRVDTLLAKPITAQRLHQALQSSLGYELEADMQPENGSRVARQNLIGIHLLLVEDNELNQELATALLQAEGVIVSHASNGKIAVSMAQNDSYDGILMDIQMPVMDGYKATKLIREFNHKIPILAMTANAMAGEKEKVIAAGMNDYISKPINVERMFEVINRWVKGKGYAHPLPIQVDTPLEKQVDTLFIHFSKIDKQAGLNVCNGNNALYLKILTKFELTNKRFDEDFLEMSKDERWDDLTRLVHSLKGGAGNIGAKTLYSLLNDLESACLSIDSDHDVEIQPLFENVLDEFIEVNREIQTMLSLLDQQQTHTANVVKPLSELEITSKLDALQLLVDGFDTGAQDAAVILMQSITEQKVKISLESFITQLESFEFDSANQTLEQIRRILKQES